MSRDYVNPTKGTISIPLGMNDSAIFTTLRGIWAKTSAVEGDRMNLTERSRILLLLGIIYSFESEIELGKADSGKAGKGTSDIGQVTYDGHSGLSIVIQELWEDENRDGNQLKREIQWLVNKGFEVLEKEWKKPETILEKFMTYVSSSGHEESE